MIIDKIIGYISGLEAYKIVFWTTFFVLLGSVPLVYLCALLFQVHYTLFMLIISMVLPLIFTPITVSILIRLSINLRHVHEHLEEEIEKNKEKDIILYEQARFVLMGEMLANISHQWKQPLNTINLSILNIKMSQERAEEEKYLDIVEDNVNYLASTIDDFMSFFDKRSSSEVKTLCFLLKEMHSIIDTPLQKKNIQLLINILFDCEKLEIASSVSQVLLNLINNSQYALKEVSGDRTIELTFTLHSNFLEIMVCDNGIGIPEEIKAKIFNPYFTTKHKTQGTGIGLYMSKQILNKLFHGEIKFMDDADKTCFMITIPHSDKCRCI